eukprot:g69791.t1
MEWEGVESWHRPLVRVWSLILHSALSFVWPQLKNVRKKFLHMVPDDDFITCPLHSLFVALFVARDKPLSQDEIPWLFPDLAKCV